MIRWLIPPTQLAVSKYVECYWYLEKTDDAQGALRPKLNPDPSAHLIVSAPSHAYRYDIEDETFHVKGSHWLYPYSKTIELDHAKSVACLGIKFKVGALYCLNDVDFNQTLVNTIVAQNFDEFKKNSVMSEHDLLELAKSDPDKCVEMLDELLLPLLANTHEDKHSEITRRAIPLLNNVAINELGAKLFCSQRTLERSFVKVTGITLKQCQSMNKLEAILEYLYQRKKGDIDWSDIACQFGFSDQPHFIRYLKQQIHLTPQKYAQQRDFTIDVYGGVFPLKQT